MSKTTKTKTGKTGITKGTTKGKLKTRIAILLDSSGSMGTLRSEAVAMFNQQIETIKNSSEGIDTKVSFVTFSTTSHEPIFFNENVDKLVPLTLEQYVPGGWTAMYDCVGTTIDSLIKLPEFSDPNCSFLFIIISDGQENYSRLYNAEGIAGRIKVLQSLGRFTFTYLGANQDLSVVSRTLNIPMGNTYTFTSSSAGVGLASSANSVSTANFMRGVAGGQTASTNFYSPVSGGVSVGGGSGLVGTTDGNGNVTVSNGGTSGTTTTGENN